MVSYMVSNNLSIWSAEGIHYQNPNATQPQPQLSTVVGFDMKMTLHTIPPHPNHRNLTIVSREFIGHN